MSTLPLLDTESAPATRGTLLSLGLNPSTAAGPGAVFSACGAYRYYLPRDLTEPGVSKRQDNDQTIRKDIGFGQRWGFSKLAKANIFALCSTDPRGLLKAKDPVGPENDEWLLREATAADCVVCTWGTHTFLGSLLRDRAKSVVERLRASGVKLHHMGLNADGSPRHPLMLPWTTQLEPWSGP